MLGPRGCDGMCDFHRCHTIVLQGGADKWLYSLASRGSEYLLPTVLSDFLICTNVRCKMINQCRCLSPPFLLATTAKNSTKRSCVFCTQLPPAVTAYAIMDVIKTRKLTLA